MTNLIDFNKLFNSSTIPTETKEKLSDHLNEIFSHYNLTREKIENFNKVLLEDEEKATVFHVSALAKDGLKGLAGPTENIDDLRDFIPTDAQKETPIGLFKQHPEGTPKLIMKWNNSKSCFVGV